MPEKINWDTITPQSDFEYHKPTTFGAHKAKKVNVTVKPGRPIYIQCPPCLLRFGIDAKNIPTPNNANAKKYYAALSFPTVHHDADKNYISSPEYAEQLAFVKLLQQIDDTNINVASLNVSSENTDADSRWFTKSYEKHVLKEFYTKTLRDSKDPVTYSPTFSTKLIYDNDKEQMITKCYNTRREEIPFTHVKAGDTIIPLVKTDGMWFAGNSFGMSFRIVQLLVVKESSSATFDGLAIDWKSPEDNNDIEYSDSKKRKIGE